MDDDELQVNKDFSNVIVVDNCPVVAVKRYEKLQKALNKIFSGYGKIVEDGLYLPLEGEGDSQKTCGYTFIEYETVEMAQRAVIEADHKRLDNKHTFRVNFWTDFEKYADLDENKYVPPEKSDYESKANLTSWLMDEDGRDQFVVRFADETQVWWNDPLRKANEDGRTLKYGGEREKGHGKNWTELYVAWSPRGSYMATFHMQGIVLWGGDNFEKLGRFSHSGVKVIDFSPGEKYLVTCNMEEKKRKNDPDCIIVWDIRTAAKLRGFEMDKGTPQWPVFKWSHDDLFLAKTKPDAIQVYQAPGMGLLNKKSIKVPGVKEIQWSPSQNLLSYWVPEHDNVPCVVALLEIPSRQLVREKHLYSIADIKMHWQPSGDHLCVKLSRMKTKKTMTTNFEIFRMRQKEIPVEVLEMDDNIFAFAWEKSGPKFAVIHGPGETPRPNVSFYELKKNKLKHRITLDGRPTNCLFWSPTGQHVVLAGLGGMSGALEFFDTNTMESACQTEHFNATDVEWDPSGRFVITAVCQPLMANGNWRNTMENGYRVWSPHGVQLATLQLEKCYQILWRPRPPTLLTRDQIKDIRVNLKEMYWKRFEAEDDKLRLSNLSEDQKERARTREEWRVYRQERLKEWEEQASARQDLRGGDPSDDEDDYMWDVQVIEEQVSSEVEKIVDAGLQ